MFWSAYTHSMPSAEWFGEVSMFLLIFIALRYGITLRWGPNPGRQRGERLHRRPPERRCHQIPSREPQPSRDSSANQNSFLSKAFCAV
ncbi:hypothetical protein HZS61_016625 [Fusarium oxysporum f. sp. conglutinans]|uniref:Uncharacterized protein n=1 Tax=Fusarium oxysporum f. sp. conglutinans TaxID=100902 RepID=A0A8H6GL87_FUSOX|nr:hypothetical protein HZS61_016625 [Fusarium oxysporum f. sp. conglutinans]